MKKLSTLVLSAALSLAAGQTLAQSAITVNGMPVPLKPASVPSRPVTVPAPAPLVVKDFKAARDLELERNKFQVSTLQKYQKCLGTAKDTSDVTDCKTARDEALDSHLATLNAKGKFEAAYVMGAKPGSQPPGGTSPLKTDAPVKK